METTLWRRLGTRALTLILYAVLVDIAVETFRSGASIRWWVAGTVAAYLVLCVFLWWREKAAPQTVGWVVRPTASFFVFLGLLAATAWVPEGTTRGVAMLGQPTGVVFSAVTAAAIALAGIALVRMGAMPTAGKWVTGMLTVYGVSACVAAIVTNTPYPALFQGDSFWRRLPFWMQGAVIGGLLVVPIGLVGQLVAPVMRIPVRWRLQQIVALTMSLVIVASGITAPAGLRSASQKGFVPATSTDANPRTLRFSTATQVENIQAFMAMPLEQRRDQMEKLLRALEAFNAAIRRDTFDPLAILAETGREPSAIFRWVRDQTVWVPYSGVLRGPVGVLMDRTGNDLDRALLLAQLLKSSGKEVRLAHGQLSTTQAREVLRDARPQLIPRPVSTSRFSPEVNALLDQYAKDDHADAMKIRKFADELLEQATSMAKEAGEQSAMQAQAIAALVGLPSPSGSGAAVPNVEGIQDHWWVQWRDSSSWTDFDPTLPRSELGQALTNAQETVAPETLDPALYHQVEIRVITERWEQGRLEETPVLTHVLRPSDLYGTRVELLHLPIAWPQDSELRQLNVGNRFKDLLIGQHEWLPVLQVGSRVISQFSFTDTGEKRTAKPGAAGMLGTGIARKLDSVFGGLGLTDQNKTLSVLTGESIEYEIRSPGQPARRIRRQLFDLIGPAQRAATSVSQPELTESLHRDLALTLTGKTDILVSGSQLSREFVSRLFARGYLANREALLRLASNEIKDDSELQAVLGQATPMPGPLYGLALSRSIWSRHRDDVYLDRPNIISSHEDVRENPDGSLQMTYSFDIVANDVAARPNSGVDPSMIRLEQGVLDTNTEAMLGSVRGGRTISSVSEMHRQTASQGVRWLAIRGVGDPTLQKIELQGNARARLTQDLAAGYVVVAPVRPIRLDGGPAFGWWRVDPKTGVSLGIGDRGWGSEMIEYLITFSATVACLHAAAGLPQKGGAVEYQVAVVSCFAAYGYMGFGIVVGSKIILQVATLAQLFLELTCLAAGGH